ncbi:HNH endonuclease [Bacillus cereus]|uniref:HNH endonuclease n=1 Tax=Bacillus cereus TaxID=1396 RepID=UPI00259FEC42|nr:HNH endonuclease signature motif containing protein [Bacillus cereus]MDM5459992.1 HNH endonuclease signature motif containing protein [Bacillus cereus]
MRKYKVKENQGGTLSLIDVLTNAELQRECSECRELKLAEDFQRYTNGHLRAQCRACFTGIQRETSQKHRLKRKIKNFNDRALEKGLEGNFTIEDYNELVKFAGGRCMLSGEVLTPEATQLDHVVALSKLVVGSTASNVWLLHKRVNEKKWIYSLKDYLTSEHGASVVDKERLLESVGYLAGKAGLTTQEYIDLLVESEKIALVGKAFFNN